MIQEVETGVVNAFYPLKGFGFIRREKGKDIFFFYDQIEQDDRLLLVGDIVSFFIQKTPKGLRAFNIKRVSDNF
ncbi:retron Se72 family effector protein [Aeromonas veronii]|uniref:retron Se72 family effector protein n=1 Tax=Aeromonas veronii TaxID=654 RepID=UPI003BA33992